MSKILGANLVLKHDWHMNFEGSPMGHPADPFLILRIGKDAVDFLGEGHVLDLLGLFIVSLGLDFGEVAV